MADELYRSEIVIDINDQDAIARAQRVQKRFEESIGRIQKTARVLSRERIAPVIEVRDKLTQTLFKADRFIKKLSLEQASPVLAAQDRVSAVVARISAVLENLDKGKYDVVADMKGPLMDEIVRAKEALRSLSGVKAGPVADLRGELFGQLARAQSLLKGLDDMIARPRATLIDRVSSAAGWIGSKLRGLTGRVWTVTIRAKNMVTGAISGIMRAVTSPLGMLGIGIGGAAVTAAAVVKPLQLAGQMEQAKIGFETMLKSGEKADRFLKDLQRFAALTPFEFPELQDASKRLLAFGFSAKEILPTMTAIGNAASGLGIGAEGIDRLILAIGQMRAKAKVSGEEMRQLTEAGIPAWDMLAKAMGKSTAEVMKMSEKGLIPASKAIDIFIKGMNERFPNMMARQSRSLLGLWSTIKDVFNMGIVFRWGDGLSRAVKPRMERLVDLFTRNEDVTKRWGDTLEKVAFRAGDRIMTCLERAFNMIDRLLKDPRFQKADLFGKTQILWSEIIVKPFDRWWASGGKEWATRAGTSIAQSIMKGILEVGSSNPLMGAIIGKAIGGLPGAAVGAGWGLGGYIGEKARKLIDKAWAPREAERYKTWEERTRDLQEKLKGQELVMRPAYGQGAIVMRPQFALVGEAGPEAIIPLTRERERALRLWTEAGRWLGANRATGIAAEEPALRAIEGGMSQRVKQLPVVQDAQKATGWLHGLVSRVAATFRVPVALLRGLIQAESSGRAGVVSRVGAIGLTQVMPSTARSLGYEPAQLRTRPDLQVEAGAKYLSQMLRQFESVPLALAAYNAGPNAVRRYKGIPPYPETQAYVKRVMSFAKSYGLPGYAKGTIATRPHIARVAEEGPEAIIPLTPRFRLRALELWQEAGQHLGVKGFKDGGFTTSLAVGPSKGGSNTTVVHIHMGEAVKTIQVNSRADAGKVADEAAGIVARNLRAVLENLAS
ncbi:MAG: transglycosylase SLT domain-containing protein [Firmicutes bacterium]|nr:transglycosylase SLT domain-containing protein [Bacillota bacterium]